MPSDNSSDVCPGDAVHFPRDGESNDSISRVSTDTFNLEHRGTYQVMFQVTAEQIGQLVIGLDSGSGVEELDFTVVGRDATNSQIVGIALIKTTERNSLLSIRNPSGEGNCLTITPNAGGPDAVTAHLIITRIG